MTVSRDMPPDGGPALTCESKCTWVVAPHEALHLTARARPGFVFRHWGELCSGVGACDQSELARDALAVATFESSCLSQFKVIQREGMAMAYRNWSCGGKTVTSDFGTQIDEGRSQDCDYLAKQTASLPKPRIPSCI